jgi:hypothetical protein
LVIRDALQGTAVEAGLELVLKMLPDLVIDIPKVPSITLLPKCPSITLPPPAVSLALTLSSLSFLSLSLSLSLLLAAL